MSHVATLIAVGIVLSRLYRQPEEEEEDGTQQQQGHPRWQDDSQGAIQEPKRRQWERDARRRHRKAEALLQEKETHRLQEEAEMKLLQEEIPAGEEARRRQNEELIRFLAALLGAAKMADWKGEHMHYRDNWYRRQARDHVLWQEDHAHRERIKAEARPLLRQAREARMHEEARELEEARERKREEAETRKWVCIWEMWGAGSSCT